jgi:transcriptional regulator with XRE-family HTH domain
MDDLATRAGVSRSTLHRIEHDHGIRPTAPKLAQILSVLEIEPDDVRTVIDDEKYAGDVLHWMERSVNCVSPSRTTGRRQEMTSPNGVEDPPDLVAVKDGRTIAVGGTGIDELSAVLKAAGWLTCRPD